MRVLVVDQYALSAAGRGAWKRFLRCVVSGFDAQNIHANFSVRRGGALADFIYLPDSAFVDPKALVNFDRVDMVFVGGQPSHRPWSPRIRQVLILLRMCFLTNKCLFASTFACHAVAYICATGGDPDVEVIAKGRAARDLPAFAVPPNIRKHDLFLDVATGDMFQYESFESRQGKVTSGAGSGGEWMPFCQSGLRMRSKFLLSLPRKYKPREPVGKLAPAALAPNTLFETVLTVRNAYIQHWAFRNARGKPTSKSFRVSRYNEMDIDEKSSGSSKRAYRVLADSGDGLVPEVIECGNLFGTQFECCEAYPATVPLVHNFIAEKYAQMNRHGYTDTSARFMLMDAGPADSIDGLPAKDHRTINPSPLLARLRRNREEVIAERERLLAESAARKEKEAAEVAAKLRRSIAAGGGGNRHSGASKLGNGNKPSERYAAAATAAVVRHHADGTTPSSSNKTASRQQSRQSSRQQRRRRPQSAKVKSGRKKHISDPRLQKPQAPSDRKRMARPSSALPCRALVLPRSAVSRGPGGGRRGSRMDPTFVPQDGGDGNDNNNRAGRGNRPSVHFEQSSHDAKRHQRIRAHTEGGGGSTKSVDAGGKQKAGASGPRPLRWQNRHVVARNVVHTEVNEHKPFSSWNFKYKDLTAADKAFSARPVAIGIAASGPYISQYKHDRLEYMKSKLKWVGDKGFRRFFGQASSAIGKPSGGINGSGQYREPSAYFREPDDRSRFIDPRRGWRKF
jgi:hypothetical protein